MTLNIIKDEQNGICKWNVTIDAQTLTKELEKAEIKLLAQVEIPGFRKGKAPSNIAKKNVNAEQILQTASKAMIRIAYDFALSKKPELMPSNKPEVKIEKLTHTECEITFTFDLPATITLGKYYNIEIPKPNVVVLETEIKEQIKLLQDRFAIFNPKEKGNLALGDTAIFDFVGFLDGEKFAGGEAKDMELEIGSGKFIPGFEDAMIGMKPESKKTIDLTFPENYHVPTLKGKMVKFEVELKAIKIKTINEDLEELVKDVNIPDVTNKEQLLANIKNQIENQKTMTMKEQFMEALITKIAADSKIVIPNFAVKAETERLETEFKKQLAKQNFTIENYLTATGLSYDEIMAEIKKDAISQLQKFLIIEEVIKTENIQVTEEEIQNQLLGFASQFKISIEEVKKNIKDLSLVATTLKRNKAFDLLWNKNGQAETELKAA